MNYKLSPSDLTFLYEGCKRCFYLKVKHNISQPSIPLPSIFSKIASLLKEHYAGKHTKDIHEALPPGIVNYGERYVKSDIIQFPNHNSTCFIIGRFDISIEFEDGTYGVIDFKTGNPNEEYFDLYSRQLHSYAYALENPTQSALSLSPVNKIGLLYFYPTRISQQSIEIVNYEADIHWIEIEKNEQSFLNFLDEVLELLESPEPPISSPDCKWCDYFKELVNLEI